MSPRFSKFPKAKTREKKMAIHDEIISELELETWRALFREALLEHPFPDMETIRREHPFPSLETIHREHPFPSLETIHREHPMYGPDGNPLPNPYDGNKIRPRP
jgi:hypothetical protein